MRWCIMTGVPCFRRSKSNGPETKTTQRKLEWHNKQRLPGEPTRNMAGEATLPVETHPHQVRKPRFSQIKTNCHGFFRDAHEDTGGITKTTKGRKATAVTTGTSPHPQAEETSPITDGTTYNNERTKIQSITVGQHGTTTIVKFRISISACGVRNSRPQNHSGDMNTLRRTRTK